MYQHGGARPRTKLFNLAQIKDAVLTFPAGDAHASAVGAKLGINERTALTYLAELVEEGFAYRELNGSHLCFVIYPAFDPRTWK